MGDPTLNPLTGTFIIKKLITSRQCIVLRNTMDIIKAYRSNKNMVVKTVAIATTTDECRGTFHIERHYQLNKRKRDILITLHVFNLSFILSSYDM